MLFLLYKNRTNAIICRLGYNSNTNQGELIMDYNMRKYPRTPHLEGSRLQVGDEDLSQIPFSEIADKNIVIEEKIDGANCAISFDGDGNLLLQSRGHYLVGGFRERHYNLLKQWANINADKLFDALSDRYIMFGEWMYAKHAVFYDALPDYFMEFDIYDRELGIYLDTASRKAITDKIGIISSVPVLGEGKYKRKDDVLKLLKQSNYITESHLDVLKAVCEKQGLDYEKQLERTDPSTTMEGLYIKVEENGQVVFRVKFVRRGFVQIQTGSDSNWHNQPIVPNQLKQ